MQSLSIIEQRMARMIFSFIEGKEYKKDFPCLSTLA